MAGKFPNLLKTINPQIQAAHETLPKKKHKKKTYIRYIIKTLEINNKNATREAIEHHVQSIEKKNHCDTV